MSLNEREYMRNRATTDEARRRLAERLAELQREARELDRQVKKIDTRERATRQELTPTEPPEWAVSLVKAAVVFVVLGLVAAYVQDGAFTGFLITAAIIGGLWLAFRH